jgi:hypothetical protein
LFRIYGIIYYLSQRFIPLAKAETPHAHTDRLTEQELKKKKRHGGDSRSPAPKGESGAPLAGDGDDGAELDSLRGDVTTDSAAGRRSMVTLRVTAPGGGAEPGAAASVVGGRGPAAPAPDDDDEGEKEAYLRSLPRPESGRGPATVSSHSWSRSPIYAPVRARPTYVRSGRPATAWCAFCFESDALALFPLVLLFDVIVVLGARGREA